MRIRAFHGLRYDGNARAAGERAAPPYDQIDARRRDILHRTPFHFSHLTVPVAGEDGTEAHRRSAELHATWLDDGVVSRDDAPSLYANSIELPSGDLRYGLVALLDLEPAESGIVRPHEETVAKTVAERLDLLRTTGIDYEPILALADDGGALDTLLARDCATAEPLADHQDDAGNRHRLFRISEPERLATYRDAVTGAHALIADGHHRYKTAALYAAEIGASRGSAAAAKLSVLTSLSSTALSIDPIHRALEQELDVDAVTPALVERGTWQGASGGDLAAAVAEAPQPALGVLRRDGRDEIWRLDPARGPNDLPPAASRLSVVLLHRTLFPLWSIPDAAATDGTVRYRSDPDALFEQVRGGAFATGLVLPPMSPAGFADAIADGDVLPPKSTRFLPKVVSGLVWAAHSDPVV